jgi:hypothetical protein
MRKGMAGAGALIGGIALVCSACGGGSPSASSPSKHVKHKAGPDAVTTTSPPSSAPATTTTTTTTAPAATTSSSPGLARCAYPTLSISAGHPGAGLGHVGVVLLFKNVSTSPCTLSGYPGAAGLNASGQQVTEAQRTPSGYLGGMRTGSSTPPVVTLGPGSVASAMVEGTDVPQGSAPACTTYSALLVTPPTSKKSKRITARMPGCSPLQVHPVLQGTTGSTTGG